MTEAIVGIIVGVAVALISQIIAYLFGNFKTKQKERRQEKSILTLLYHELKHHQFRYNHLIKFADDKIEEKGPEHEGYSYTPIRTDAYEKVFLGFWHLLPDEIVEPVVGYYEGVSHVNALSGDFSTPTPVPIERTKRIIEGVQHRGKDLMQLIAKYIPSVKAAQQ